jgi:hypothetical protein
MNRKTKNIEPEIEKSIGMLQPLEYSKSAVDFYNLLEPRLSQTGNVSNVNKRTLFINIAVFIVFIFLSVYFAVDVNTSVPQEDTQVLVTETDNYSKVIDEYSVYRYQDHLTNNTNSK